MQLGIKMSKENSNGNNKVYSLKKEIETIRDGLLYQLNEIEEAVAMIDGLSQRLNKILDIFKNPNEK